MECLVVQTRAIGDLFARPCVCEMKPAFGCPDGSGADIYSSGDLTKKSASSDVPFKIAGIGSRLLPE